MIFQSGARRRLKNVGNIRINLLLCISKIVKLKGIIISGGAGRYSESAEKCVESKSNKAFLHFIATFDDFSVSQRLWSTPL